jgi:hypothetical protein
MAFQFPNNPRPVTAVCDCGSILNVASVCPTVDSMHGVDNDGDGFTIEMFTYALVCRVCGHCSDLITVEKIS